MRKVRNRNMAMTKNGFEYYVFQNEIIISGVTDKNLEVLDVPSHINRFPVVSIEREVFRGLQNLIAAYLPDTLQVISNHAFADCPNLKVVQCNADGLMIHGGAFKNCEKLTEFNSYEKIYLQASVFENCKNLRHIECEIGAVANNSFAGCKELEMLLFAEDLCRFHANAFVGCDNLFKLMFKGSYIVFDGDLANLQDVTFVCGKASNIADLAVLGYRVNIRDYL